MSAGLPDRVFRHVLDRTAIPFVLMDHAGTVRYASRHVTRLTGWDHEELVGRTVFEFLDEEDAAVAAAGVAEVQSEAQVRNALPVVFPVRHRDGRKVWLEVAVVPVFEEPDLGLIALRLRPWDADHLLGRFLERLVAGDALPEVLGALAAAVAASMQAEAVAVHHGWDGERFMGVCGSWGGATELPLDEGPWVEAVGHEGTLRVPGEPRSASCWLVRVGGTAVPPAVLSVWTRVEGSPLMGHRTRLATAARYLELAIVRIAEHDRLAHLAGHDALTGVANRASFRDRLARSLATGEPGLAVAFCDLDGFKRLNDTHGHAAGDDVLVAVAGRIRATLRDTDELARMGGDEFTILARKIAGPREAEHVARRLQAAVAEPFAVAEGVTASVGISVGIALARPGATADDLLRAADEALYESKRSGGRRTTIRTTF